MKRPVYSFSIRPDDDNSLQLVELISKHSKKTSIPFSRLILQAIDLWVTNHERESNNPTNKKEW